jgi:hypothetical protein
VSLFSSFWFGSCFISTVLKYFQYLPLVFSYHIFLFGIFFTFYTSVSTSQFRNTALIIAAYNGHAECARLFNDTGADKDAKDDVRVGLFCWGSLISI